MFEIGMFDNMTGAAELIYNWLAGMDLPTNARLTVCHSVNADEVNMEEGDLETLTHIVTDFLRDLDAQEGVVVEGTDSLFDFQDSPANLDKYYANPHLSEDGELPVRGGEGVVLIHNPYACHPTGYPVVVVKKSHYAASKHAILECLKARSQHEEYTAKIAPAIFVEIN